MKRKLLVTAAILLPLATAASAAQSADWAADQLADRAAVPAPRGLAPAPDGSGLKSGSTEALAIQLEGAKVLSSQDEVVGTVEKVVEIPGTGRRAVVVVGGFLGIGGRRVLLPAESLVPGGRNTVRSDLSRGALEALPSYDD